MKFKIRNPKSEITHSLFRWFMLMVNLLLLPGLASAAAGRQYNPNPDFDRGMDGWRVVHGDAAGVKVIPLTTGTTTTATAPATHALELRAAAMDGLSVATEYFPVEPLARYRFSAMVRRIQGEAGYSIHVAWFDKEGKNLSYDYVSMGALIGTDWLPYTIEAIAPEGTATAAIRLDLPAGWACQATRLELTRLEPGQPRLALDLVSDPAPPTAGERLLSARLENRGTFALENLRGRFTLPAGLTVAASNKGEGNSFSIPRLAYGEATTITLKLSGQPAAPDAPVTCTVEATALGRPDARDGASSTSQTMTFSASTRLFTSIAREVPTPTGQLPMPKRPPMDIKLGSYYFPVTLDWNRNGWGVRPVNYLEPLLGYYDEASPEVADWHSYWALEHGISFFVYDWYFNQGYSYLNDALEQGFLKSRFGGGKDAPMQFCIDWCNEGHCGEFKPVDFDDESLRQFITTLCERYFNRPNYLRVDGKPVVIIHVPVKIANAHGGWDGCRAALDRMREVAKKYGHPGVYFVGLQNNTPWLWDFKRGGFDCATAYAYGFRDVPVVDRVLPYERLMPRHQESFETARENAKKQGIDYIPSAWIGWDDAARSNRHSVRTEGNTPAAFRRMIEMLPAATGTKDRLALFESWNEWGEGGQAEPGIGYRFGRLGAIRDALTKARGPYDIAVPTAGDIARFDTKITYDGVNEIYYRRYAHELGLERGFTIAFDGVHDLYLQPSGTMSEVKFEQGLMRCRALTGDPSLTGPPGMDLPAEQFAAVRLRMSVSAGRQGQLYWRHGQGEKWSDQKVVTFPITADGQPHDYTIRLTGAPGWQGKVYQFRLDPTDAPGAITLDELSTVKTGETGGTDGR